MSVHIGIRLLLAVGLSAAAPAVAAAPTAADAHAVSTPDWRDQVIYFLMVDRFDDGNPANNDQGTGEYDPTRNSHFSGGDLAGVERRLDYIRGLGATAVWITPPVANQWWDPSGQHTGYHGYWASDFMAVDPHFGTLADYQRLARALHGAGMQLVQDIVVNHTGDYFDYQGELDPDDPTRGYVLFEEQKRGRGQGAGEQEKERGTGHGARDKAGGDDGCPGLEINHPVPDRAPIQSPDIADQCRTAGPVPRAPCPDSAIPLPPARCPATAPTQAPFNLNDPRRAADRRAGIYHWTAPISDYLDPVQLDNGQMSGLDDLDTANPHVRSALRQSYNYWIDQVGVDGFRVDTAFYVPPEDFDDFLFSKDRRHPGVLRAAAAAGREDFLVFGEGFGIDTPYTEAQARRIDRYMRAPDGSPRMPGMLNFPLYGSTLDVFARGRPTAELGYRIESMLRVHQRPGLMPSFVDNHDVDRFLAGGSEAALKQSLLLIMTLPGIPTLCYGTEQGFREPRAAMFKGGYGAAGRDHFDVEAPLYRSIQSMTTLRRAHPTLSRGTPSMLATNAAGAGALAYRMDDDHGAYLVVFNSADTPTLLDNVDLGLSPGARLHGLYAIDSAPDDVTLGADGRLTLSLPARAGLVWQLPVKTAAAITLDALASDRVQGDFEVSGSARGVSSLRVVVDGQVGESTVVQAAADGRFSTRIDTAAMIDPDVDHRVVAWSEQPAAVSMARTFRVAREWHLAADQADPAGDDHGRNGRYQYPTAAAWNVERPADIERVRVWQSGNALKIELTMHQIVALWNPPNGFDHVAFNVFVELPGSSGIAQMPGQSGDLPQGLHWNYRIRAHGWSNALFSAAGASASTDGTPVIPTASIAVDRSERSVTFTIAGAALGKPASLRGARLYLNTWDYDGSYRPLASAPGPYTFGGGQPGDPLVMDETAVLVLP